MLLIRAMICTYEGKTPKIAQGVFIAPTAVVIGDVEIGKGSSVWYGAVLRADQGPIRIGEHSNIQDNCTVHVDSQTKVSIGDYVTIGHNAVIHGCTIASGCLVGMGAVVLNGAQLREGSVVAAGAVVRENQVVGPYHLVAGSPARLKRELTSDNALKNLQPAIDYAAMAQKHMMMGKE